jgi:hypothetical protein
LPGGWNPENIEHVRIKSEWERFGVGMMYCTESEQYATYEILVEKPHDNADQPVNFYAADLFWGFVF